MKNRTIAKIFVCAFSALLSVEAIYAAASDDQTDPMKRIAGFLGRLPKTAATDGPIESQNPPGLNSNTMMYKLFFLPKSKSGQFSLKVKCYEGERAKDIPVNNATLEKLNPRVYKYYLPISDLDQCDNAEITVNDSEDNIVAQRKLEITRKPDVISMFSSAMKERDFENLKKTLKKLFNEGYYNDALAIMEWRNSRGDEKFKDEFDEYLKPFSGIIQGKKRLRWQECIGLYNPVVDKLCDSSPKKPWCIEKIIASDVK